ncbi:MAG TPA: ubiquitin-like domain-containing protein [Candidatus Baltobacteraceae bacterium]
MIGRGPSKTSNLLAVSVLTIGLVTAGFATHPSSALAAALAVRPIQHVISFESDGSLTQHVTTATTVAAFLRERGITVNPKDYVHPGAEQPLTDNLVIDYQAAVPVHLITAKGKTTVTSTAGDVGALLEEQHIDLGKYDEVHPSLADRIVPNSTIRVVRVSKWVANEKHSIAMKTIRKISFTLPPGKTKVVSSGRPGMREMMVRYTQRNGRLRKQIVASHILRKPKDRVIEQGIGEWAAFAEFAKRGLQKTSYIASNAVSMVATAYTAGCAGCSGWTATGERAGHGIVAVDPRVIPLGTKLYIPGYGPAIAGDTGGAIRGDRIDLGFNSLSDALRFGRRTVKVYELQ